MERLCHSCERWCVAVTTCTFKNKQRIIAKESSSQPLISAEVSMQFKHSLSSLVSTAVPKGGVHSYPNKHIKEQKTTLRIYSLQREELFKFVTQQINWCVDLTDAT